MIDRSTWGWDPKISLHFDVKEGMQNVPMIQHVDNLNPANGNNFPMVFVGAFMERYFDKSFGKITAEEKGRFYTDMPSGKISIPITDAEGNTFELAINKDTKVNIFLAKPGDFTPDRETKYEQSKTMFDIDAEGNITIINIVVASNYPDITNLRPVDFSGVILYPAFRVFAMNERGADNLVGSSVRGPDPYFEVIYTP